MRLLITTAATAVAACLVAPVALAQGTQRQNAREQEKTASADEIIVTASKSGAQNLQSAPLAIQAFGGETLQRENIKTMADLIASVPGVVESQNQSVASRSYNLRGAGGSNANGDSPIGYYVDDVPFNVTNFGIAPPIRFIDIDRVEVLRGPQGTLYGQGSAGGVFIFHTRDPNLDHVQATGEASTSSTRDAKGLNYEFAGALSVPVIKDVLAVRVSGGTSENKGYAEEYFGAFDGTPDRTDVNYSRNDDIRVVALLQPVQDISIRAQYWHFRPRQNFLGALQSVRDHYYSGTSNIPSFGNGDFKLYSLSGNVNLNAVELSASSTWLKGNFGIQVPITGLGFFSSQFYPSGFTQEVRANSTNSRGLHWVVGGQYQNSKGPQRNSVSFLPLNLDNNTLVKSYAGYGEVSYDLLDGKLVPLLGIRQYHEKRTFGDANGLGTPNERNVTNWRANLSYLPSQDLTLFATVATGFRPGIVLSSGQAQALALDGIPFNTQLQPETITNFEAGVKARLADRTVRVTLNVYQANIKNQQTSVNTTAGIGAFVNFGDARSKGIDFDLSWDTPLEGFTLSATGNVNDSKYTRVDPLLAAKLPNITVGGRQVNSVLNTFRLNASYNGQLTEKLGIFGNVAMSHTGNRRMASGATTPDYNLVDANLGLRQGAVEIALFASNIFDFRGPTFWFDTTGISGISANPRTVGVRLRARYD